MVRRRKRNRPKRNGWIPILWAFVKEDESERVNLPELNIEEILAWADAHFARTGEWPTRRSGAIPESPGESWMAVQAALFLGLRGLAGGSTLPKLLLERRGRYNRKGRYRITENEILEWADEWRERTGEWPRMGPEVIPGTPGFTWTSIDNALRLGRKRMPGGSSLVQLLAAHRGVRNTLAPPKLTVEQILDWADAFSRRQREWPHSDSGPIDEAIGETWCAIDVALKHGRRGLPGNSSLARLLAQRRGVFRAGQEPTLTVEQILAWADAWHERVGDWPSDRSDRVPGLSGIRWGYVDDALRTGRCGLPGGSSLARLLAAERGVRRFRGASRLSEETILKWADQHFRRTGAWPTRDSGSIFGHPQNAWSDIEQRLQRGGRGLPGGSSLARLLAERRGKRNRGSLPPLCIDDILAWADAVHERTGTWPQHHSGPIAEVPGETWGAVQSALANGCRGLEGGSSLARLLTEHRGVYNPQGERVLSEQQILGWADAWHARVGRWPTRDSGAIPGAGGMTWGAVAQALREGTCGLPGSATLGRLLRSRRSVRGTPRVPNLTEDQIVAWADEHYRRMRTWPKVLSGPIFGAAHESWSKVDQALRVGVRGLPGGSSLACLLAERRGVRSPRTAPPLSEAQVLAWADTFYERSGTWPNADSGPIAEAPGETWCAVDNALRAGRRSLSGGSSLSQLLAREGGNRRWVGLGG
jgi:hypothetical protein